MTTSLEDTVKDILIHHGALIDHREDCIESLFSQELAQSLNVPEFVHICFSGKTNHKDAISLTHESVLFERLGTLFTNKGRFAKVRLTPAPVKHDHIPATLSEKIPFNNAVSRYISTEEKAISYTMFCFKFKAISDETQEGIVQILVNGHNLSTLPLNNAMPDILDAMSSEQKGRVWASKENDSLSSSNIIQAACKSAEKETKKTLCNFIKSLNRRLDRNIIRIDEYYSSMVAEVEQKIEKKQITGSEKEKELEKIKAIQTEQNWKVQDLISKFALHITMDIISVIRLEILTPVFLIQIKRRKKNREFPVTYNPILRRIDPLPCESCFSPEKPYYVCDDGLHIVCKNCFSECPVCGKKYCSVCSPHRCPRCKNLGLPHK